MKHTPGCCAAQQLNSRGGLQGDLLCCESCPGVLHAGCAGLPTVPEGDWHCPHCVCAGCGHAGFGERPNLDSAAAQVRLFPLNSRVLGVIWSVG